MTITLSLLQLSEYTLYSCIQDSLETSSSSSVHEWTPAVQSHRDRRQYFKKRHRHAHLTKQIHQRPVLPLQPSVLGPCPWCGAILLKEERYSHSGSEKQTPCCNNGHIQVNEKYIPTVPNDILQLYGTARWRRSARYVNHAVSCVTTGVVRSLEQGGLGFHFNVPSPPCMLSLQGSVMHWKRPLQQAAQHAIHSIPQVGFSLKTLKIAISAVFTADCMLQTEMQHKH